jgi:hypothetical protein
VKVEPTTTSPAISHAHLTFWSISFSQSCLTLQIQGGKLLSQGKDDATKEVEDQTRYDAPWLLTNHVVKSSQSVWGPRLGSTVVVPLTLKHSQVVVVVYTLLLLGCYSFPHWASGLHRTEFLQRRREIWAPAGTIFCCFVSSLLVSATCFTANSF